MHMSLFAQPPEKLLHFLWEGVRFRSNEWYTTDGQRVEIIQPGRLHQDQGPDFLHAQLRIGDIEWRGHVEIHVQGDDWYRHGHHRDEGYNACVLHVVYRPSVKAPIRQDGSPLPEIVIADRVSEATLRRYQELQLSQQSLPCVGQIHHVPKRRIAAWLDRLSMERMEDKALRMQERLRERVQDWEQVLWEETAASLGGPVNQEGFRDLAKRVGAAVLRKEATDRTKLEALLFGASGMLPTTEPGYAAELMQEWRYLQEKHGISSVREPLHFLRMRPAGFPTLRLSQMADLWTQLGSLMPLLEQGGIERFLQSSYRASAYWDSHYRFGEESKPSPKRLGHSQQTVLAVNVFVPLGWLYQIAHGREHPAAWLEDLMTALPAESNKHTRVFTELGWPNAHALHAQAMIQLHKRYCTVKRCLDCHLGQHLLDREGRS